ncbi:MAG: DNA topoisomerase 3 [Deltaproteobacteria bacterium]|nr:DNA topoisomerase 3 [Deltaproteobacteria bacterium]
MGKFLVIAEKPSVARDIAAVLGGCTDHDGWLENDGYVVTFAVGHLFELLPPEEVDPVYKRWTLDNLPILPERFSYRPKSGQSERIRTIKKLLAREDVDTVVNACDAGREGELIFREIVEHLESEKPTLRLWLQSMTTNAIRKGFDSLLPGSDLDGLAAAAACRARTDWLIGMNATRALTKRLKSRKEKTAWSAGRVQTPTLALLVARELEVLAFQPVPYWKVSATFDHAGVEWVAHWFAPDFKQGEDEQAREDRLFDEERANAIAARVANRSGEASETRKPSRESAPPLFDLTSLQREANRRFGWSARRALSAAQRLYERHKVLTYPRTDSRCLPEDYRSIVDDVLGALAGAGGHGEEGFPDYAKSAERLQREGLENDKRIFNDEGVSDHFAIVPTGNLPEQPLTGDDRRLFDLVVRRFLGAFHPPALWERVERVCVVEGESFRARARVLEELGWRAVLPPVTEETATQELAPLAPGQNEIGGIAVTARRAEVEAEQTKPPPRITEARLLSLMENAGKQIEDENLAAALHEKGIGTPATRADIIENLIAKSYVVRADKSLRPTVKGIRLIDTLERIDIERLTSPKLTGEIEYHLMQVEKGERSADDFMSEMATYASAIVDTAKTFEYDELYDLNESLGECPGCKKPVIEMAWFYRCKEEPDVEREGDCPVRFWKDTSGRYLDRGTVKALIAEGRTGELDGFTARNGRTYRGYLELLPDEDWKVKVRSLGYNEGEGVSDQPEYEVNPDPLGACPFHAGFNIVETPTLFICENEIRVQAEKAAELARKAELIKAGEKPSEARKKAQLEPDPDAPEPCGLAFPRTVCKREIVRDEAEAYLKKGRTELLTDFTSRFGRPFSATLVLKPNGRHGFEFQPREPGRGKKAGKKKAGKKKAGKKQAGKKKASKKKASKKKTAKKTTKKKTAKKKAAKKTSKKAATRKASPRKKAASAPSAAAASASDADS